MQNTNQQAASHTFNTLLLNVWDSHLIEIAILITYLELRLVALTATLPVFIDEVTLIGRARELRPAFVFVSSGKGKWLLTLWLGILYPNGPETLWLSRAAIALLSPLNAAVAIKLGRLFGSRNTGRLAGLLTVFAPMALFHERQALADALMAIFVNLAIVTVTLWARTGRWRYLLPVSLALAGAALSKIIGLAFFPIPVLGGLLVGRVPKRKLVLQAGLMISLSAVIVLVFLAGYVFQNGSEATSQQTIEWCHHTGLCNDGAATGEALTGRLAANMGTLGRMLVYYFGLPFVVLTLAALVSMVKTRWREMLYLFLSIGGVTFLIVLVGSWFPARYFDFTAASLAALAALGATQIIRRVRLSLSKQSLTVALAIVVVALPVGWHINTSLPWLQNPSMTHVPRPDDYANSVFDCGCTEVTSWLADWQQASGTNASVVSASDCRVSIYWGNRLGGTSGWNESSDDLRVQIALWLLAGHDVFFIDDQTHPLPASGPFEASLKEVAQVDSLTCGESGPLRISRLTEAGPQVSHSIYEIVFPNPNDYAEHYRAIALHLIDNHAQGAVVVYPPNQQELLASRLSFGVDISGVYAIGDSWPLDVNAATDSLALLLESNPELYVVFLDEQAADEEGTIREWLNTHLELVSQDWFGPVELLRYQK